MLKNIAIFRHTSIEGPGYLAPFLDQHGIPWQLFCIDKGDAIPGNVGQFSGLVFMGGPMSVNDDLPWIPSVLELIRNAVARDIPVLGHCLGAQLMAKALGKEVTRNAVKEIGWGKTTVSGNETAQVWFGDIKTFDAFHWHGETFSLPQGASHLLSSEHCDNQAFALGKHLALQCHVEINEQMIAEWCEAGAHEIATSTTSPAVQDATLIQQQAAEKLHQLQIVARQLYRHWVAGLTAGY
jgi:GMP synthase-like glutamine amidotransferase